MRPYYVTQPHTPTSKWIDLDHVLAISEIETDRYDQESFEVIFAFLDGSVKFWTDKEHHAEILRAWKMEPR